MSPLFTTLSEAGRPDKNATAIVAFTPEGVLCTFKGKNLDKIPFENVTSPLGMASSFPDSIGEFVSEPQGLDLSFVVAYTMRILFPSVLVHQLLEKGYDVKDLPTLSYEAFFKEVLSSYFSEAMVESFAEETSFSFSVLQSRMKKSSFTSDYLSTLNALTALPLGVSFSSLRFGVAERSSLKAKTSLKSARRLAQKASR